MGFYTDAPTAHLRTETISAAEFGSLSAEQGAADAKVFSSSQLPSGICVDHEGVELPDLEAAKSEARDTIRELAAEYIKMGKPLTLWSIRICDADDRLLAEVATSDALHEVIAPVFNGPRGPDSHA